MYIGRCKQLPPSLLLCQQHVCVFLHVILWLSRIHSLPLLDSIVTAMAPGSIIDADPSICGSSCCSNKNSWANKSLCLPHLADDKAGTELMVKKIKKEIKRLFFFVLMKKKSEEKKIQFYEIQRGCLKHIFFPCELLVMQVEQAYLFC